MESTEIESSGSDDVILANQCEPCKASGKTNIAIKYCKDCSEYLCNECTIVHSTLKATKLHIPIPVDDLEPQISLCEPCRESGKSNQAFKYCIPCDEHLCNDCTAVHKTIKATKTHEPIPIEFVKDGKRVIIIHNCEPCFNAGSKIVASKYCKECDEHLCSDCTDRHKTMKATSKHIPEPFSSMKSNEESDICEKAEGLHMADQKLQSQTNDSDVVSAAKEKQPNNANQETPGKPTCTDIGPDFIYLTWEPSSKIGPDDHYQISIKDVNNKGKWKLLTDEFSEPTAKVADLKTDTAFLFRVRVVYEEGEGPYSKPSDEISTTLSSAARMVEFAQLVDQAGPSPSRYALPMTELIHARNHVAKSKKFEVGNPTSLSGEEKTILLIGATGTGKSTLVDGLVNYVLGVNWDDPFRFTVISLEEEEEQRLKNQALSQTEWITCYSLNPESGCRIPYRLNIIDSPGFGDTRGLKRDQEIVEQIRHLFSNDGPKGVSTLDAVCFLIKAPDARLTPIQSYIFQSIMSLFGKDIEHNICSLITFADGNEPPVLAALKEANLPFGESFTFNNSGLFAKNTNISSTNLSPMFWEMGLKSFQEFFRHLDKFEAKSLQLTKHVLDERFRLETTLKNLQPKLDSGLNTIEAMKKEIQILENNKALIKDNKDFHYEVSEEKHKKERLLPGLHVTNCIHCNFTCHYSCGFANDDKKRKCSAMDRNGYCTVCPHKCFWQKHANTPYRWKIITVTVKKTYEEKLRKYKDASGKLPSHEQVVTKMSSELETMANAIEDMMLIVKRCNERLEEIALRPNPLSMTQHIDLMIQNERMSKKDGFLERIKTLTEFRKRADISSDFDKFSSNATDALRTVGKTRQKKKKDTRSVVQMFRDLFGV